MLRFEPRVSTPADAEKAAEIYQSYAY